MKIRNLQTEAQKVRERIKNRQITEKGRQILEEAINEITQKAKEKMTTQNGD